MDSTARLGLNKPNPDPLTGDFLDVSKLNENFDKLDAAVSATVCTSTTRPAAPFNGQIIIETDTLKIYMRFPSQWIQVASVVPSRLVNALDIERGSSGQTIINGYVPGEAQPRVSITTAGGISWGPGGATAPDTNLFRAAANLLKTDDSLQIAGDLIVNGTVHQTGFGPLMAESTTAIGSITNTAGAPGSPVVGFGFTAPPSGTIWVSITGNIEIATNGNNIYLGYQLYQGSTTVGSGTLYRSYSAQQALSAGKAVTTGGANGTGATRRFPVDGLTPGGPCNIRLGHWVNPAGTGSITYRQLCVERV